MKRAWIAIALLASAWLPMVGYFHRPDAAASGALILVAVLLLIGARHWEIDRGHARVALIFSIAAAILMPWPYRVIPFLLAVGLGLRLAPIPRRWPRALSAAAISAAMILLVQAVALFLYINLTARQHDLPNWLGHIISCVAPLLGINAHFDLHNLALGWGRVNHSLGATWELLLDPATFCFLVGGIGWLGWKHWRGVTALFLCVIAWLPLRLTLLLGLLMHRSLSPQQDIALWMMNPFWSMAIMLLLLAGPAMLAWRFVGATPPAPAPLPRPIASWLSALTALGGTALIVIGLHWDPIGDPGKGRLLVDDFHSPPQQTVALRDQLARFYEVAEQTTALNDAALSHQDVLILLAPVNRFTPQEITTIRHFVFHGGGVVLVGDGADAAKNAAANELAAMFGFTFRDDLLCSIDGMPREPVYRQAAPHPIVQHLSEIKLDHATSIQPSDFVGRPVILSTGLRDSKEETARYGAFIRLWSTRYGDGRVVGFADAAQFSKEPSDLLPAMADWLNRRPGMDDPMLLLGAAGLIALAIALELAGKRSSSMVLAASAVMLGWATVLPIVENVQRHQMPATMKISATTQTTHPAGN